MSWFFILITHCYFKYDCNYIIWAICLRAPERKMSSSTEQLPQNKRRSTSSQSGNDFYRHSTTTSSPNRRRPKFKWYGCLTPGKSTSKPWVYMRSTRTIWISIFSISSISKRSQIHIRRYSWSSNCREGTKYSTKFLKTNDEWIDFIVFVFVYVKLEVMNIIFQMSFAVEAMIKLLHISYGLSSRL